MSAREGLISALRGCRCTTNFAAGDQVEERHPERSWRRSGRVLVDRPLIASHVIVEWDGEPGLFRQHSLPPSEIRHRGHCPVLIKVGMRVKVTGSTLGLREGEIGRVTAVAPSGIVTVQTDSGKHTEAWRRALTPLGH
jgi:hypothetical protein